MPKACIIILLSEFVYYPGSSQLTRVITELLKYPNAQWGIAGQQPKNESSFRLSVVFFLWFYTIEVFKSKILDQYDKIWIFYESWKYAISACFSVFLKNNPIFQNMLEV